MKNDGALVMKQWSGRAVLGHSRIQMISTLYEIIRVWAKGLKEYIHHFHKSCF